MLIVGHGIEGDRYASQQGTYSILREPGRQITLVSSQGVQDALASGGCTPLANIGLLRRNVVLSGVGAKWLTDAIGHEITLGEALLFVHRNCVPCKYNAAKNGQVKLMDALWDAGGVNCEVICGGKVRIGDTVQIVRGSHNPARINTGGKSESFFLRPRLRTPEPRPVLNPQPVS